MLRHARVSSAIGAAAKARFEASDAVGVLAANSGCLLRWENLLGYGPPRRVLHPVLALWQCYAAE
jgi:hypothetical protein